MILLLRPLLLFTESLFFFSVVSYWFRSSALWSGCLLQRHTSRVWCDNGCTFPTHTRPFSDRHHTVRSRRSICVAERLTTGRTYLVLVSAALVAKSSGHAGSCPSSSPAAPPQLSQLEETLCLFRLGGSIAYRSFE